MVEIKGSVGEAWVDGVALYYSREAVGDGVELELGVLWVV